MANVFIEECKDSCSLTFVEGLHFRELIIIQRILKRHCNSLSDLVVDLFKLNVYIKCMLQFPHTMYQFFKL